MDSSKMEPQTNCCPDAVRFEARRARRVFALLAGVWMLNGIDLLCTSVAQAWMQFTPICEINPIAAWVVAKGPLALAIYKFSLVGGATVPLLIHRRRRIVELAATMILVVYVLVAVHWQCFYTSTEAREMLGVLLVTR